MLLLDLSFRNVYIDLLSSFLTQNKLTTKRDLEEAQSLASDGSTSETSLSQSSKAQWSHPPNSWGRGGRRGGYAPITSVVYSAWTTLVVVAVLKSVQGFHFGRRQTTITYSILVAIFIPVAPTIAPPVVPIGPAPIWLAT